jgi:hypothetical protein
MEPNKSSPKAATHREKEKSEEKKDEARQSVSGIIGSLGNITR